MILNKETFVLIAMKAYDNTSSKTLIEFEEDLSKFSNLVRLCAREQGPIETHLLLNCAMTLLNIFETETCVKLMFFKVRKNDWFKLKTILVYLSRMPNDIQELNLVSEDIELCQNMVNILRKI
jgi:hypothetical protein